MTLKNTITVVSICSILITEIFGASFSNVYVQSKPVEYVKYGSPTVSFATPEIAQISATPVETVIPVDSVQGLISPCVAPCVIPRASIAVGPPARANIIAYKSQVSSVPVVLANKDDGASYQYSYAVYDEQTGDQKSQSEFSDGSVVQGQYSLTEPNGSRREVTYTADDLKGFNAVVRNILPETKADTNESNVEEKKELTQPCNQVISEQLKDKEEQQNKDDPKEEIESHDNEPTEGISTPCTPTEIVKVEENTAKVDKEKTIRTRAEPMENNTVVTYNEIIKCLQAKLRGGNIENRSLSDPSPLTYILLPSLGSKPC